MRRYVPIIFCTSLLLFGGLIFQNCESGSFIAHHSEESFSSTLSQAWNPYALLTGDQILRSMYSVTGLPTSKNVANEYDQRQASFASNYELKGITPPMLIGMTDLASVFCTETLVSEVSIAFNQRKLFNSIDFTQPISAMSSDSYLTAVDRMAVQFWGHSPTASEQDILLEGRSDFITAMNATELADKANTQQLMKYTCSAMLASFDAISF
jgi:hypothetical protein